MNKDKEKRRLKSKLQRLEVFKLSLQGLIRNITDEIIHTNEELTRVEAGKPSKKRKQVDISNYINNYLAEEEKYKQKKPTASQR
ncbi:hypothetical protein [Capnocytophaga canis]|uniref:hypothetical protein n=1 Tax=Capnocytophaga canis TaxID=1848903 RepID=UPI001BB32AED|nr:hypothetical protein [Capnocytophaga canis]